MKNDINSQHNNISKLREEFPTGYAIYDLGSEYGLVNGDNSFCIIDKSTLETKEMMMRYEKECIALIEKSIPIWYAEDDD